MGNNHAPLILVLEPEETPAFQLEQLLQQQGWRVQRFSRAREGLAYLEKAPAAILISEWELPDLQGEELCARVQQDHPDLPLIFLASLAQPELRIRAIRLGALDYVFKPFDRELLLAKIARILSFSAALKKRAAGQEKSELELSLLEFLRVRKVASVSPRPDLHSSIGFSYPVLSQWRKDLSPEQQLELLEALHRHGVLERQIFDVLKFCPHCNSPNLNFRAVCPQCRFPVLQTPEFQSLDPMGVKAAEKGKTGLKCSKCGAQFLHPVYAVRCLNCGEDFDEKDAKSKILYAYRLPEAKQASADEGPLQAIAREVGLTLLPEAAYRAIHSAMDQIHREMRRPFGELVLQVLSFPQNGQSDAVLKSKLQSAMLLLSKILPEHSLAFYFAPDRVRILIFLTDPLDLEGIAEKLENYFDRLKLHEWLSMKFSLHGTSSLLDRLEANLGL